MKKWLRKWIDKKTILRLSIAILTIMAIYTYGDHNLKSNSIYYVRKFKPEVELALIVVTVENIKHIKVPKYQGVKYSVIPEYEVTITNTNIKGGLNYPKLSRYWLENRVTYTDGSIDSSIYSELFRHYDIDDNLKLYKIENKSKDKTEIEVEDEREKEKITLEMKEVLKPILEVNQERPLINLQWIFNWKYKDRFN